MQVVFILHCLAAIDAHFSPSDITKKCAKIKGMSCSRLFMYFSNPFSIVVKCMELRKRCNLVKSV